MVEMWIYKVLLLILVLWFGGKIKDNICQDVEATLQELELCPGCKVSKALCYAFYGILLVYYPVAFYIIWII